MCDWMMLAVRPREVKMRHTRSERGGNARGATEMNGEQGAMLRVATDVGDAGIGDARDVTESKDHAQDTRDEPALPDRRIGTQMNVATRKNVD